MGKHNLASEGDRPRGRVGHTISQLRLKAQVTNEPRAAQLSIIFLCC